MNPNDLWSIPPIPKKGENNQERLYTSVGRALSAWEHFESLLAHLFSHLIGLDTDSLAARRAYGCVVSFSGRADMLTAAAEAYFDEHPDDEAERKLADLLKTAKRASGRRNDIAHGCALVFPRSFAKPAIGYCLVPGAYNTNRNNIDHEPSYAYTCKEIDRFHQQFVDLAGSSGGIFVWIIGRHQAQRAGRIPPSQPKKRNPKDPKA